MRHMTSHYAKPLPRFYSEGSREFYDGCKRRELLIQRCLECRKFRFPPQLMCSQCHSTNSSWVPVSGRGFVATFTVIPGFEPRAVPMFSWPDDSYPINVIIVELSDADGVHIVSNLVGCDIDVLQVGLEVEVVFDDVTDAITLPRFRPVDLERVSND